MEFPSRGQWVGGSLAHKCSPAYHRSHGSDLGACLCWGLRCRCGMLRVPQPDTSGCPRPACVWVCLSCRGHMSAVCPEQIRPNVCDVRQKLCGARTWESPFGAWVVVRACTVSLA